MDDSIARQNILNKISQALLNATPMPHPTAHIPEYFFNPAQESLVPLFERKFTGLLGKFFLFESISALREQLLHLIKENKWVNVSCTAGGIDQLLTDDLSPFSFTGNLYNSDVAITDCIYLVARTGTIVLGSNQPSGRALPVYAPIHIVIANAQQIVFDLKDSIEKIISQGSESLPSTIVFASGPSRTGDIEKTLVVGVHGPREVYVLMLS